ncbi:hypothetical protein J421_5363 (plasmid) [Gemmatirosa kalamazoonensis]|uniref:Uncharacterized protein n=1 Tax=Gemmatirosa kalamazoonensis TaxID=861299 RepID=W0RTI5_9BACT|nr:hypothetical protein [Gemmatirosa kalamazoonensis]AHG92898.1 hypothetical protein J421_5363 [Gemmatirosa kalamazoonensis]
MSPSEPALSDQVPDLTSAEFQALLADEVASLDAEVLPTYRRCQVPPVRMEHRWEFDGRQVGAPVWVVARDGPVVLGYDEVEEEWGIGRVLGAVADGGVVDDWGTFGERLRWTLLRFPDPAAYVRRTAG